MNSKLSIHPDGTLRRLADLELIKEQERDPIFNAENSEFMVPKYLLDSF